MKIILAVILFACTVALSTGFTLMGPQKIQCNVQYMSTIEPSEKEEKGEGLDLDLGEMFQMFDAADEEANFEDAIKKVKGEQEN